MQRRHGTRAVWKRRTASPGGSIRSLVSTAEKDVAVGPWNVI